MVPQLTSTRILCTVEEAYDTIMAIKLNDLVNTPVIKTKCFNILKYLKCLRGPNNVSKSNDNSSIR